MEASLKVWCQAEEEDRGWICTGFGGEQGSPRSAIEVLAGAFGCW